MNANRLPEQMIARHCTPRQDTPPQIPGNVLAGIIADAAARFPGDYQTQAYVIKTQVTAWQAIEMLKATVTL